MSKWSFQVLSIHVILCISSVLQAGVVPIGNHLEFNGWNNFDGGLNLYDAVLIDDQDIFTLGAEATIEAWVKQDVPQVGQFPRIVSKWSDQQLDSDDEYSLDFGNGGDLRWVVSGTAGHTILTFPANQLPAPGEWYHVAGVLGNGQAALYVNGLPVTLAATPVELNRNTNNPVVIGAHVNFLGATPKFPFNGGLDEIRIWNVARTPQEILDNHNASIDPMSPGLLGYYPFEESLPSQSVLDHSPFGHNGWLGVDPLGVDGHDPLRVPEPTSGLLLILGSTIALLRKRSKH